MEYIKIGIGHDDMPQLKPCELPRQVRWIDLDGETGEVIYGIQFGDQIICACCGGVFLIDELNELARESFCTNWVEVSKEWVDCSNEMAYNW